MSSRHFSIHLHNDTPHPLRLESVDLAIGSWGGATPPDTIEPHAFASWHSHADRILSGTEGAVEYRVDERDGRSEPMRLADPTSTSALHLHWCNPRLGTPDAGHVLRATESILPGSTPTVRDYVVGVAFSNSSTPPASGWVETVFAMPSPAMSVTAALGQTRHAHLHYRIRRVGFEMQASELVADLRDAPGLALRPVIGAAAQAWYGTWASSLSREPAIDLRIDRHDAGRFDVSGIERNYGEVFRADALRLAPTRHRDYQTDVWTHPARGSGPVFIGRPVLGQIDRAARAGRGIRRATGALFHELREREHGFGAPLARWGRAVAGGLADAGGLSRWFGAHADTLRLSADRRLMLYGVYTPDRQLVRYQLRYLRTTTNGTALFDVMLAEYLPIR